ncbi:hypothetical protein HDV01_001843, partial [Terramyces sp. JEL0728]
MFPSSLDIPDRPQLEYIKPPYPTPDYDPTEMYFSPFDQSINLNPYWLKTRLNDVSPDVAIETALPGELPTPKSQVKEFFSFP